MIDWQPIETAPKRHQFRAILLVDGNVIEGWWNEPDPQFRDAPHRWELVGVIPTFGAWRNGKPTDFKPTHWAEINKPGETV